MKKKLLNLIELVAFLAVLAICILGASILVRRRDSDYKYTPFFEQAEEDNIDVLFMGSSHVINGIDTAKLFEDYGITSYNMGGHGSVMQATYWELIEALDYCTPKWVVVDAYMLEKNFKYLDVYEENAGAGDINTQVEQLHLNMDAWPLNRLKIAAVQDLIQDKDIQKEFLFDFIVYHSRWNELTDNDYRAVWGNQDVTSLMGSELRREVEAAPYFSMDIEQGQTLAEHTVGQEYLMKIIDECQRRGIGVLVTYLPFCADTQDKLAAGSAGFIADMYGVPYINMLNTDIIDMYTDLNDTAHLNASGAAKVTDYLGRWLMENGDLQDHRDDPGYDAYRQSVLARHEENVEFIESNDDLYSELEMLSLDDVSCVVYINQGSNAFKDNTCIDLVRNISGTDKIRLVSEPYILIKDVASSAIYEAGDGESLQGVPTGLGTMVYQPVEQLFRFFYSQENPDLNYLYDDAYANFDIQIIAYDRESGEILCHKYFRSYGDRYRAD